MSNTMDLLATPESMRAWAAAEHAAGRTIGIVPTMGALHAGHLALIDATRARADSVVVTVFVNPLQFNESADFDSYPRPIDDDLTACRGRDVDAVYAPTAAAMYPPGFDTHVEPGALAARLEGPMRPGHFRGVATVVTKLLGVTGADVAAFGEKDYQQLAIVRRMVADLELGVEIVGVPIVREPDGLALSSRNVRLTPADRSAAVVLSRGLAAGAAAHRAGERDAARIVAAARQVIDAEPRAEPEYVELVDAATLEPLERIADDADDADAVLLTAAWFGDVRLIDNHPLRVEHR